MNPIRRWIKASLVPRKERRRRAPADVVIVSFPKSGRTWLRLMIGKVLCEKYGLPENRALYICGLTKAAGLPLTVLTHDGGGLLEARHVDRLVRDKSDYRDKKVLVLARDPRDVVTSCYFHASRRRNVFRGSIADFVRDPRYGVRKVVTFLNIWHENRFVPREFELIRYEDLHEDPHKALRTALEFIGPRDLDDRLIRIGVEFSRFDNMKHMEQEQRFDGKKLKPGDGGDPEANKMRKGEIGRHRDYLSPDDIAYCDRVIEELGCPLAFSDGITSTERLRGDL
jgi:hypothetical protein